MIKKQIDYTHVAGGKTKTTTTIYFLGILLYKKESFV